MSEYREDDQRDRGYCPQCGRNLGQLTNEAKGWCELHGWVFADFTPPKTFGFYEEDEDE